MQKHHSSENRSVPSKGLFFRSAITCGLIIFLIFGLSLKRIQLYPISQKPLSFNAGQAYQFMTQLAKGFPNRVTWSEERKKSGAWITSELKKMGYSPKSQFFSEVIAGNLYSDLENIYVEKKGKVHPEEVILAVAHYDIADTTHEGAMDDASGVGVVLELARIFAQQDTDRTVVFLLTDSEEYGAFWGATAFVRSYERVNQIIAVENFDFITAEKQTGILTLCDGLKSGYTPLWLREIALNSIRSLNQVEAVDMTGVLEAVERALGLPAADHGVFLAAGIPAFNWVGQTDNFPHIMGHYHHTLADTADALQIESFESYGKAAERVIYSIDELSRIPDDYKDASYWKLSERYYLSGWAAGCIQVLLFLPFLIYTLSSSNSILRTRTRGRFFRVVRNETKNLAIVLGSLLLGYAILLLLPTFKVITQYELFPATQRSLLLDSPNFGAIFIVFSFIGLTFFVFKKMFVHKDDSIEDHEVRHSVHTLFLSLIIFLSFLKNGYLAVLLLLPPAYFWTGINLRHHRKSRLLNGKFLLWQNIDPG